MFPIVVTMGGDPYHIGLRAVSIALRNDSHRIVGMAQRCRSIIGPKRKRFERVGVLCILSSGVLWYVGASSSAIAGALAGLLAIVGVLCISRGALLAQRQRDIDAVLDLALHVRETLEANVIVTIDLP